MAMPAFEALIHAPVVLITGATGPLGRVAAQRFAQDGARLATVGRDEGSLDALRESLGVSSDRWLSVPAELTDADAASKVAGAVTDRWGRIDVLLHLVGGWAGGTPVVDLDHAEVRRMLDQHLWTTLHVAQAVVPGMVERGVGRVLAVSSPLASDPGSKGASYAIAKAAEEVLIRSLAREVAGSGVTANLVIVRTLDANHERETAPSTKNASWTTPEEVAGVLAFLASPAAAALNGARIPLHGRG
jgi:NAD(P)-dependent dehydrogenase (short-subunit alcohol dehydrogenase family)